MFPRMCAMLLQEMNPRFADKKKKLLSKFVKALLASMGKMRAGQYFSDYNVSGYFEKLCLGL